MGHSVPPAGRPDGADTQPADLTPTSQPGAVVSRRRHNGGVPSGWLRTLVLPLIVLAWLALAVLAVWVLSHFTHTILILVLAGILAFAFTPLANFFMRWVSQPVAIALAYILGLGVVFTFGAYIVATAAEQITNLVTNLPTYAQQAQALQPQIDGLLTPFGVAPGWSVDLQSQAVSELQGTFHAVAVDVIPRLAEFFGTVIDLVLVLILSIYLCSNGARIANWLKTETPGRGNRNRARIVVAIVNSVIGGYIRGVLLLAALIGALVGIGLEVLGVPYAVLLGVLAFFMEFIPVLGVFISGAASVLIALVSFREPVRPLIVLVYFIVIHVIEGDVVGPRIMGRAVGIHPATGLIALVAGTEVFGVWGALFAAPLAGLLQQLAVVAWVELLGDRNKEMFQAVAQGAHEEAAEHVAETAARS